MKNLKVLGIAVGILLILSSCNKADAKQVIEEPNHEVIVELPAKVDIPLDKKVHPVSNPIKLIHSETFINKLFVNEFSNLYPKNYKCVPQPDGTRYGDINGDNNIDVLIRYTVEDNTQNTWAACGWIMAFSNDKKELDKFIYFDWSSGPGSRNDQDLGFPVSINNGQIKSTLNIYASEDANCCPSIKREITYYLDKELYILDSHFVDTKDESNN
ncbi:hypothetical protein DR871_013870 [Flavobacterium petrolei]|uniref:Lipoprotein n=1 Tax=Flavobacterium petrolei TaxID=2259594 RepID=A0A482TM27_9FLAO|nr:hypothetical protein [Flavobacterium petrolei]RYJ51009.1 hypothetical protein DR871_013870 [Flavobacterium petrolei]